MPDNIEQINQWLDTLFAYGPFWVYLAIFFACFIENIFPPFPGDTFIVAAGLLVGLDRLNFYVSLVIVSLGGMLSVYLIYLFGKWKGRAYFEKKNFKLYSREDIQNGERNFKKYGALILIFSRFVVGFRSALALAAGISRYNQAGMIIFSSISYVIFGGLLIYLASTTVENYDVVMNYVITYQRVLIPLLLIIVILYILRKIIRLRKTSR